MLRFQEHLVVLLTLQQSPYIPTLETKYKTFSMLVVQVPLRPTLSLVLNLLCFLLTERRSSGLRCLGGGRCLGMASPVLLQTNLGADGLLCSSRGGG